MGKLKNTIKKLAEDKKIIAEKIKKIEEQNVNDAEEIVKENLIIGKKVEYLRNKLVDSIKSVDDIKSAIIELNPKENLDNTLHNCYKTALNELKENNVDVPPFDGKSFDEVQGIVNKLFVTEESKKRLDTIIRDAYGSILGFQIYNDLEKSYNVIEKYIDKLDMDEINSEVNKIDPSNYKKRVYSRTNEKEINDLLSKAKNDEEIEALNYVNENILIERTNFDTSYDKEYSETYMSFQKKIIKKEIAQNLNGENIYKDVIEPNELGFFRESTNIEKVDKQKVDTEISKNGIKFSSEKTKDILKKALKKLSNIKKYDKDEPIFKLEEFKIEEQKKVYAFKNISNLYADIKEATLQGRTKDVVKLTNAYKKCDKEMTELMNLLAKIDTPFYPGNVSLARNNDIPPKYSGNIKGTSMVDGLWQLLGTLKSTGISVDEFFNNPTLAYVNFINKKEYIGEEVDKQNFTDKNDFLNKMIDGSTKNDVNKALNKRLNMFRGFEFLACLDKENYVHNYEAYQVIHNAYMLNHSRKVKNEVENLTKPTNDKIKKFILSDLNDKRYFDKFTGNNNYLDEIRNIDSKEALDRLNGFRDNQTKEVQRAVKEAASDIVKEKGINDKEYIKLCNMAGKNCYKVFKDNMQINDIALSIKANYDEMSNDIVNKNNFHIACNYLKIVDEQYNKRTWFGKHLRKEGRAEKDLMNKIKKDFTAKGIPMDDINNFLNGNKTIDDLETKLVVNSEKEKAEEVNNEISDIVENVDVSKLNEPVTENVKENEITTEVSINEIEL